MILTDIDSQTRRSLKEEGGNHNRLSMNLWEMGVCAFIIAHRPWAINAWPRWAVPSTWSSGNSRHVQFCHHLPSADNEGPL